jgi:hypothetical protein
MIYRAIFVVSSHLNSFDCINDTQGFLNSAKVVVVVIIFINIAVADSVDLC